MDRAEERLKVILKTSVIGIICNVFLAAFKVVTGIFSNSIAIIMDGINNLSDAASSLITIIGAALAGKNADKKHPFGYGRMEYLSSLIISAIVLYTGVTSLVESVKKIVTPEESDYSAVALIIITVAIFVKLFLALFTQKRGNEVNSDSLIASGKDALNDVLVSLATLVAALILKFTGFGLEAYLATVISVIIIKAGVELLMETVSKILGEPSDVQIGIDIKKTINSFEPVHGAYDLVLNDYGPETYIGSVHVEVDDTLTAKELDELTRDILDKVMKEHNVYLTAIGFYSKSTTDETIINMESEVRDIVMAREYILGFHGFYANVTRKMMSFDLVVSLDAKDRKAVHDAAVDAVKELFPDYTYSVGMDMDMNELANSN